MVFIVLCKFHLYLICQEFLIMKMCWILWLFPVSIEIVVVQMLSPVQLFATPRTAAHKASPSLLKLTSIGDATQPSHPLSLTSPAFNPSQHQDIF